MRIHFDVNVNVHLANVDQLRGIDRMLRNLLTLGNQTMTVITDAATAVKEDFARMEVAFTGISGDIALLIEKLEDLAVSPEDQAALDEVVAMAEALAVKFEGLDALNPPVEPPVEPPVAPPVA